MLAHLTTWLFGPPARIPTVEEMTRARLDLVHGVEILIGITFVALAGWCLWQEYRLDKLQKRLKRQEQYLRKAIDSLHRSGVVTDDIEIEHSEAK
jgi:hypothetical protein